MLNANLRSRLCLRKTDSVTTESGVRSKKRGRKQRSHASHVLKRIDEGRARKAAASAHPQHRRPPPPRRPPRRSKQRAGGSKPRPTSTSRRRCINYDASDLLAGSNSKRNLLRSNRFVFVCVAVVVKMAGGGWWRNQ